MSSPSDAVEKKVALLEATLFASGEALSHKALADALGWAEEDISKAAAGLRSSLVGRGLQLVDGPDGYALSVAQSLRKEVGQALKQSAQPLSQSALEVLTIVAYQQPVAKTTIDEMRGVASDASLKTLLARDLIVSLGMKDGAMQYRTTNSFLAALGLTSDQDLPPLKGKL